ncbi:Fc receptor-like protein 5 [Silurus asotus]|uniref:Fc receptor-like protein 5 n=1 Tax=Silurus asotus TaxID=30991 RepID=A0AAD5AI88_SILAS|nr:Fc receptor-like protein 5 [Silurus asotus]
MVRDVCEFGIYFFKGESHPVSLIISHSRTQHFTDDSLSLSCEDQSNSTRWTVRRYTESKGLLDCPQWGSVIGSTCNISFFSTSYTGVYWCESESGENSNPVNITVHDGDVILESSVHPVTEGHPLTLHCLYRNTNPSNLRADFYKDGSVVQNQTTGEMIIHKVSKSDEGFYHCKHPERGESPRSWISVRRLSHVEAPFSVLMLISSVVKASPYLLITIILLVKCYRARDGPDIISQRPGSYKNTYGGDALASEREGHISRDAQCLAETQHLVFSGNQGYVPNLEMFLFRNSSCPGIYTAFSESSFPWVHKRIRHASL